MKLFIPLKDSRYMQYISSLVATLSVASCAVYMTWSSPFTPKLISDDSPIGTTLTPQEASWVASSFLLGTVPGGLLSWPLMEKFGYKGSMFLSAISLFVPWFVIMFAKSAMVLMISRFVAGIGGAIAWTAAPMYVAEIAEKDIRGKLGSAFNILRLSGSLFVLSVAPFVSYTAFTIGCSIFPLVFAILFYFMPESPHYLIKSDKKDAAKESLIRLSSNKVDEKIMMKQFAEMESTIEKDMKNKSTLWEFFSKKEYRKSLILMIGLKTLQQLSGLNAIDAYMQTILEASRSSISAEISSIFCSFIQIPAVFVAATLVDRMGRKPLLIISSLGCAVALIGEGIYFYLQDVVFYKEVGNLTWLPITSLMLYLVMNPIGLYTLPYILMGELFASNIKAIAASVISTFYGGLLGFLVTKFFEPISDAWGMHTMFWIFAANCILGALFVLFALPETKGKTFAEIQEKLNKTKNNPSNDRV